MTEAECTEFKRMMEDKLLDVTVKTLRDISADVYQFVVFASSIGLLGGIWKVVEFWINQRSVGSVRVSYTGINGENVEFEYSKLTEEKVKKIIAEYPPFAANPIKMEIAKTDVTSSS